MNYEFKKKKQDEHDAVSVNRGWGVNTVDGDSNGIRWL